MRLAAQFGIPVCEQELRKLALVPKDERLILPTNMRHLAAGAEASLVQLIVTWAQTVSPSRVQTFATPGDDDQIDDLIRRFFGMAAILCADEIAALDGNISITDAAKAACLQRLGVLQSSKPRSAYRGPSIEIVCADHIARGTPYLLYLPSETGARTLRSRSNFRLLGGWLLKQTIPREYADSLNPDAGDAIGEMLYEVFKNTEVHGLTNALGDELDVSIRALKAAHLSPEAGELQRIVSEFAPLGAYCQSLTPPKGSAQVHLFELSVIDSGPGFASSWTKRSLSELSIEDEETAVRECFLKGSASGLERFGEGLPHVIRLLRQEQGFLRLRTGRLSLFADYSKNTTKESVATYLERWLPDDGLPLAAVAGSVLTIMIPMQRRS